MEMAGRSPSTIKARVTAALVVLTLSGCASSAPALPADTTGTTSLGHVSAADFTVDDMKLSCGQIRTERSDLKAQMDQANANIRANRTRNQVAAYIGGPALLATEGNYADKDAIKAAYARQDVLDKLAVLKGC
jgi:phage shock protein A